jgi:acyl-CoA thioesterase
MDARMLAEAVAVEMLERDAFSRWLGVEIVHIEPRRCSCRLTVRQEMVNGFGVAHGAIAFALADSAFAFACNSSGFVTFSIQNCISYPAAIHVGDVLYALAEEEAASNRLGYYRAEVRNQRGEIVALFRGTAYRTPRCHEAAAGVVDQKDGREGEGGE